MDDQHALPHLFGRFTTVLRDHRDLARTLLELRQVCVALEADQPLSPEQGEPSRLLSQLRADLADHFAVEESDSYFGALLAEEPALVSRIAALRAEHDSMLRLADALFESSLDVERLAALPRATRELVVMIERHERAESALLARVLAVRAE